MKHHPKAYYVINGITLYRLFAAPLLLWLALNGQLQWFRWLLGLSFMTDAVDGFLSRKFKVASVFGAKLDSIADDATVLVATIALWFLRPEFVRVHWPVFIGLFTLFAIQNIAALIRYNRVTSFHTYLAKSAAVFQGFFFVMIFFSLGFSKIVFYTAAIVTGIQLIEEVILVFILPEWKANVRGIFWVLKQKKRTFLV